MYIIYFLCSQAVPVNHVIVAIEEARMPDKPKRQLLRCANALPRTMLNLTHFMELFSVLDQVILPCPEGHM